MKRASMVVALAFVLLMTSVGVAYAGIWPRVINWTTVVKYYNIDGLSGKGTANVACDKGYGGAAIGYGTTWTTAKVYYIMAGCTPYVQASNGTWYAGSGGYDYGWNTTWMRTPNVPGGYYDAGVGWLTYVTHGKANTTHRFRKTSTTALRTWYITAIQ